MSDTPTPPNFPEHVRPAPQQKGVPVYDLSQSRLMFKAIKVVGRIKPRIKKRLISKDEIAIKHKKPRFY